jgi:hypothetical protein
MIGPTYLEEQNLGRHRELKEGGTLMRLIERGGELTVQAHTFNRCGVEKPLIDNVEPLTTREKLIGGIMIWGIHNILYATDI